MAITSASEAFFEAGLHLSYMNYVATGEGLTSCFAVASTAEAAERVLKQKLPEYFHPGIVTVPINAEADQDARAMIQWIAPAASELLQQLPPSAGYYFTELHYNLS